MSWSHGERLYNLLPAVYRIRDVTQGEPLRALLSVIEGELETLETDIDGLYDNWFIETCDDWLIPYIGDLLGVRMLHTVSGAETSNLRANVANTLAYRRRKGTRAVLEQLARDVTGWPAREVEFFQRLATTQHVNHVRLDNMSISDLRDTKQLELLGAPFERVAYTADVRRITSRRGKYNIPNVGLFLWRLQAYPITRGAARAVTDPVDGRYTFSSLGNDSPIFNRPQTETEFTHLAEEINVPEVLRRRPLYDELEALRQALVDGRERPQSLHFGASPVLEVFVNDEENPIPPEEMLICDLSDIPDLTDWRRPPASKTYITIDRAVDPPVPVSVERTIRIAVDPVLGRLAFPAGVVPSRVEVSYAYGFSDDTGGGPYDRRSSVSKALNREVTWTAGVSAALSADDESKELYTTLTKAVNSWNEQPPGTVGVIAILDSRTYPENLTSTNRINIPQGSQLLIVAGDWPGLDVPDLPEHLAFADTQRVRPHLLGDLSVKGTATENETPGELIINGLLIEGQVTVLVGNLGRLRIAHCTLVPGEGGLAVNASGVDLTQQNNQLRLTLERTICDHIALPDTVPQLTILDSIIDSPSGAPAIDAPGAATTIQTSTVFGASKVASLEASEGIFIEAITATRRQVGCLRLSYVPVDSRTPRRYRCQPDLALTQRATELGLNLNSDLPPAEKTLILARLRPVFTSSRFGDPGYAQLSLNSAEQIRTGAEDGSEIGAFSSLKQPQRETNLGFRLEEHLRFGLEAGIFYVT